MSEMKKAGRKRVSSGRKQQIGARMQIAAELAGYQTRAEVGEALGVAGPTVSRWWLGRQTPEPDEMDRYADLVGKSPGWFYHRENDVHYDEVAESLRQILGMAAMGESISQAFDKVTGEPDHLSRREREQIDARAPALRQRLTRAASGLFPDLSPERQRAIVDRLYKEALRPEEE